MKNFDKKGSKEITVRTFVRRVWRLCRRFISFGLSVPTRKEHFECCRIFPNPKLFCCDCRKIFRCKTKPECPTSSKWTNMCQHLGSVPKDFECKFRVNRSFSPKITEFHNCSC